MKVGWFKAVSPAGGNLAILVIGGRVVAQSSTDVLPRVMVGIAWAPLKRQLGLNGWRFEELEEEPQ